MNLTHLLATTSLVSLVSIVPAIAQQLPMKPILTLDAAEIIMNAAMSEATKLQAPGGAIAIVDDGGTLILLKRLDNSFPSSSHVATEKAVTAALFKMSSAKLEDTVNGGRTAMVTVGYNFLRGGVPILVNGQVIGAIGVSGTATAQQDEAIANFAATALK